MLLTAEKRENLIDKYANKYIDDMDMKTLYQFAYDMLVDELENETDNDLINTIENIYPELIIKADRGID